MKAKMLPLYFAAANERERGEFKEQLERLNEMYGEEAEFLDPVCVGDEIPEADAIVFPQLIGAAFKEVEELKKIDKPELLTIPTDLCDSHTRKVMKIARLHHR